MCTQFFFLYPCGCKSRGEFRQCAAKFDAGLNLRCAETAKEDVPTRTYCRSHLVLEGKGVELMYKGSTDAEGRFFYYRRKQEDGDETEEGNGVA